ncbi:MAG: FtsQ-type POTRA domain-containing protein [Ruminococcaceae bacterium]|nr:FtsQ-type POTRA domain-containing protein [Oscillospiraceae bacterium]
MVIRTKDAEGKTLSQIRRAKRERRKKRKRAVLIAMLMLGICVGMLFTPLFNLKEIDIEGNSRVDAKTIIDASGFTLGENIFKFSLPKAGEAIASIPYINSIELQRKLPGKIEINVTECIPIAYIQSAGGMVVVDKDGKVLEKKDENNPHKIPVLFDFKFEKYTLGKKIDENNNEKLKKTLEITKNLYNNNLIADVISITTTKGELCLNLRSGLRVILGSGEELEKKLTMLQEVLKRLPEGAGGVIDARNPDKLYHRSE